ncbi:putative DNA repair and transcription protein [Tieghemostelium lacteum]|uniref:MMS19 nucleotide excision repair protein n=1 Tax=Tieghemostelium lacteum TaxID=361077 RepID=A0A151ZH41_TIELA|nr:putative DNA repair and transcription protein [Tieghemostelium lacteum]|eukprot:KYQ93184.1 putative DNA repair and transcription protein [Tieghemostelium lacteum]
MTNELIEYIEGFIGNDENKKTTSLNNILLQVSSKKYEIHDIVEKLGDYLKNRDSILRSRGTLLLSEILCRLPNLSLNDDQIHFLSVFYADRCQDYPCAQEVVKGISGLITYHHPESPNNKKLLSSIFQEIHPSSLSQAHRKMVLQVIDLMLTRDLEELKELQSDFMVGFIQFIDGEKDPRNLIFSFKLLPRVIQLIPHHDMFIDSLFEILSCYFPISFNPKASDPNSISKEDLSRSLLNCFASTPLFAEHFIPFIIDKINSNLVETKLEAMKSLIYCCTKFGPYAIKPYIEDIWSTFRTIIFTHKNNIVIEESKKSIFLITRILSRDLNILKEFLGIINKECLHHIKTSQDSKIALYCTSILYQTVSSNSRMILGDILPPLFQFFRELNMVNVQKSNERLSIVGLFLDLIKANQFSFELEFKELQDMEKRSKLVNPILEYLDEFYELIVELLSNSSLTMRQLAIECLSELYSSSKNLSEKYSFLLPLENREFIVKSLVGMLGNHDEHVRSKALLSLYHITIKESPTIMIQYAIPTICQMIQSPTIEKIEYKYYLNSLVKLLSHQPLLEITINHIQSLIDNSTIDNNLLILQCISEILSTSNHQESIMNLCYNNLYYSLIKNLLKSINSNNNNELFNQLLKPTIDILQSIISSISNQSIAIERSIDIFLNRKDLEFEPILSRLSNEDFSKVLPLFNGILCQCKSIDLSTNLKLMNFLEENSLSVLLNDEITISCCKSISSIINRQSTSNNDNISLLMNNLLKIIQSNEESLDKKLKSLNLFIWITKGLVVCGNSKGIEYGNILVDLISKLSSFTILTEKISKSFDVILYQDDNILNQHSGSIINILYQQKFFTLIYPKLLQEFKTLKSSSTPSSTNNNNIISNYLISISNLLKNIPREVLLNELNEILPIVLQSLDSLDQPELLSSSLQTLKMLLKETPNSLVNHLNSLITTLLLISTTSPLMTNRCLALEILNDIALTCSYQQTFPFQNQVTNGLLSTLDDHKRLVRKEATKCRNNWFILK